MNEEDISKNGLRTWLYNTISVSNALANCESIKDRILLEYVPSGQEYLMKILDALKENRILNMTYHSYWKEEESNFDVEPFCVKLFRQRWYLIARSTYTYYHRQGPRIYALDRIRNLSPTENFDVEPFCVKLFRQRWYLIARSTYTYYHRQGPRIYALDRIRNLSPTEETFEMPFCVKLFRQRWYLIARSTYTYYHRQGPRIYALDRIRNLSPTEETFEMPKDWNASDFFIGAFGVIADAQTKCEPIKLKVNASQANYIRDLKLHDTQEEEERNEEYSIFTYYLRPTYDFQQELLWHGEDVVVLEPKWLREELAEEERNEEYSIFSYYLRPTYDFQQELLWHGEDVVVLEPKWLREELAERLKCMLNKYENE